MSENQHVTVKSAIALGVGSMVGAGIFALMGEAAALAGSAIWLSFLAAGVITILTGYSFVQMGMRYPSRGGIVEYLVQAYGSGLFSGACSVLFYIAQVIGMTMIALAFGKYSVRLLGLTEHVDLFQRISGSAIIVLLAALQLVGSRFVGKLQRLIVIGNLVLLSVVAVGLWFMAEPARLSVESWPAAAPLMGSLALTYFAYTGFAVICNSVEDMANPSRDLPLAMFTTIGIVVVLYVVLALATTAAVNHEQLVSSGPLLLVEAARAAFGDIGFKVLLISAVVATVTCINGGLYGMTRITYSLAEKGDLPERFGKDIGVSTRGLTISAALGILMLNLMSLTTVASLGSATSLLVYFLVNLGAFRLIRGSIWSRTVIFLSVVACLLAVGVWILYTLKYNPTSLIIFVMFLAAALVVEYGMQRVKGRKIQVHTQP
jgi:amino acid transporter